MNENIQKFSELVKKDETVQKKLKAAMEAYTGEQTEEAVFNHVLVPIAEEYGMPATYDEFRAFMESITDEEMTGDELRQVAGGRNKGVGASICAAAIGLGIGVINPNAGKDDPCTICTGFGIGNGATACMGIGTGSVFKD